MKTKRSSLLFIILTIAILLTACSGGRSSMVASGWASVTADGDAAYLAFSSQIIAINLAGGTEIWRFPAEADAKISFYAAPVMTEDGQLIAGGYNNVLYSLNPKNGQVNWKFDQAEGRYIDSPLVTVDSIYAPSADHNLYALNMKGQPIWQQPFPTNEALWAMPATDPECACIYLASMDHKVYAIDAQTGTERWHTEDLGGAMVGTPAVSDDHVLYIGTFAKELIALNTQNGRELWRFPTEKWVWASPVIGGDMLYFGDLSGTFYAVDRQNGQTQWQIQPGGSIVGKPLVTEDGIYFTTETGSLVSVTLDGTILMNQPYESSLHAGPVAAGNTILLTTSDPANLLIALDANGVQRWSFSLSK
jgi:outer membrane protein assembly factor BamB